MTFFTFSLLLHGDMIIKGMIPPSFCSVDNGNIRLRKFIFQIISWEKISQNFINKRKIEWDEIHHMYATIHIKKCPLWGEKNKQKCLQLAKNM